MATETFNRQEKKFIITEENRLKIYKGMSDYMEDDPYNLTGLYTICNIYYDTIDDELIRKSIEGPIFKEKMRLRGYGVPNLDEKVYLELKRKFKGVVYKRRTPLLLKDAYDFIDTGNIPPHRDKIKSSEFVLKELQYFIKRNHYEPKLYLAYNRQAFFGKDDKTFRVTFDNNIRTRRYEQGLENGDYGQPLLPENMYIMEVKAQNSVPLWFSSLLSKNSVYATSFSKYGTEYTQFIKHHQ